jgi:hypothetical protein
MAKPGATPEMSQIRVPLIWKPRARSDAPHAGPERGPGRVMADRLGLGAPGALAEAGVEVLPGPFLDFRDPWGNRVEIVGYDNIQFSKAPNGCAAWGNTSFQERAGNHSARAVAVPGRALPRRHATHNS